MYIVCTSAVDHAHLMASSFSQSSVSWVKGPCRPKAGVAGREGEGDGQGEEPKRPPLCFLQDAGVFGVPTADLADALG